MSWKDIDTSSSDTAARVRDSMPKESATMELNIVMEDLLVDTTTTSSSGTVDISSPGK